MKKELVRIESKFFKRNIDIALYGHYGYSIIIFPSIGEDAREIEHEKIIEAIARPIEKGRCKVFVVSTPLNTDFFDIDKTNSEKTLALHDFNEFMTQELIRLVYEEAGGPAPIMLVGANRGAFYASSAFFKRPDLYQGLISIDGFFDVKHFIGEHYDDNAYFNSPERFLPNLYDEYWLSFLKSKKHIYLISTTGKGSHPERTEWLANLLSIKKIPNHSDYWGAEWNSDYDSWRAIISEYIHKKI